VGKFARTIGGLVLVAALVGGGMAAASRLKAKITRAELGITAADASRCEMPALPVYARQNKGYDRRVAAADYLPYATATLNVYPDGKPKGFTLDKHSPEWSKQSTGKAANLTYDVYHRSAPARLDVLVVYRGTDALDSADWIANFAWLWSGLPVNTRYDDARTAFKDVRTKAFAAASGRKVTFTTAGHSLGGGIAQHVARAFPCTSATVFNSSFVTLDYRLAEPHPALVVHTFEDMDELTRLRRLLFVDAETDTYKHYKQDAVGDRVEFQHTMTGLAVGMARQVLRCVELKQDCKATDPDGRVKRLYCGSGFGSGKPVCKP
jgi:hypothetical protein